MRGLDDALIVLLLRLHACPAARWGNGVTMRSGPGAHHQQQTDHGQDSSQAPPFPSALPRDCVGCSLRDATNFAELVSQITMLYICVCRSHSVASCG
jgi:hypothetical protein